MEFPIDLFEAPMEPSTSKASRPPPPPRAREPRDEETCSQQAANFERKWMQLDGMCFQLTILYPKVCKKVIYRCVFL